MIMSQRVATATKLFDSLRGRVSNCLDRYRPASYGRHDGRSRTRELCGAGRDRQNNRSSVPRRPDAVGIDPHSSRVCPSNGRNHADGRMPILLRLQGSPQRLKPRAGDCCVFYSFGSLSCPPIQADGCFS